MGRAGLGFDTDPAHLKILRCADRTCPCPHGVSGSNGGNELTLQHTEFSDEAFLFLQAQTSVAAAPQKAVPAPGPAKKALDRFRLGTGRTRGIHDVHAKAMEHFPLFAVRQTENQPLSGPLLGRLGFNTKTAQSGQASGTGMPGAMLENEEVLMLAVQGPVEPPIRRPSVWYTPSADAGSFGRRVDAPPGVIGSHRCRSRRRRPCRRHRSVPGTRWC